MPNWRKREWGGGCSFFGLSNGLYISVEGQSTKRGETRERTALGSVFSFFSENLLEGSPKLVTESSLRRNPKAWNYSTRNEQSRGGERECQGWWEGYSCNHPGPLVGGTPKPLPPNPTPNPLPLTPERSLCASIFLLNQLVFLFCSIMILAMLCWW